MLYPVAIRDNARQFTITVPGLPGCIVTGETLETALANARRAIGSQTRISHGYATPASVRSYAGSPAFEGALWGVIDTDLVAA